MPLAVRTLDVPTSTLICPCCTGRPMRFNPLPDAYVRECEARGVEHPLDAWETLNLDTYLCPLCGATDRDRLQALFLAREGNPHPQPFPLQEQGEGCLSVLEIAPSPPVSNWLRRQPGVSYRSADLWMSGADDRVDIADMACYEDGAFDAVICSHVLEHIPDDGKALREIQRILSPQGFAVLLVPISTLIEGVSEDPEIRNEAEQWRRFGQGDHVRIYGRSGFVERLEKAGFRVETWSPTARQASTYGLSPSNRIYVARKPHGP